MNFAHPRLTKRVLRLSSHNHLPTFSSSFQEISRGLTSIANEKAAGVEREGSHFHNPFASSARKDGFTALNKELRFGKSLCQQTFATLASLLRCCGKAKALSDGRRLHAYLRRYEFDRNTFLGNCLIQMYGSCGSVRDAQGVFNNLSNRNICSWNTLIQAYAQNRRVKDARAVFDQTPDPDLYSWNTLLKAYALHGSVEETQTVFDNISSPDMYSWNILLQAYAEKGNLQNAKELFVIMPQHDVVSWSSMISACVHNGDAKGALNLFHQMQLEGVEPERVTFVSVLDACATLSIADKGQHMHIAMIDRGYEKDVIAGTALVNMYAKCGSLHDAKSVFGGLLHQDVVSWTAIISACVQNGRADEALGLFHQMQSTGIRPNKVTFVCGLEACTCLAFVELGLVMHAAIIEEGYEQKTAVGNALVNMYGKCKNLCDCKCMFDRMPHDDVVSWSAMIAACAHCGHNQEALDLFFRMHLECVHPNQITYVCALDACASLLSIRKGKEIHIAIAGNRYESVALGNALINMYGKCGSLQNARSAFDTIPQQDVISWNAMISTLAQNGRGEDALHLFLQMQLVGIRPDKITFISVLAVCSYTGQVNDGRHVFASMSIEHGITPSAQHYACMIDLLGRAGNLDEAENLISNMPLEKDAIAWSCLLGACRIHGDVKRGQRVANQYFKMDSNTVAPFVVLSNIFAMSGRWGDAANLREALKTCSTM